MQLKPGDRVRCVAPDEAGNLTKGAEYTVKNVHYDARYIVLVDGEAWLWQASRFKPVVRVKAPCVPTLSLHIKRALAAFDRLTPEQQQAQQLKQRESWVAAELELAKVWP